MIAIRGVYERHEVMSLNHGIGFDTAAIELLLPAIRVLRLTTVFIMFQRHCSPA